MKTVPTLGILLGYYIYRYLAKKVFGQKILFVKLIDPKRSTNTPPKTDCFGQGKNNANTQLLQVRQGSVGQGGDPGARSAAPVGQGIVR